MRTYECVYNCILQEASQDYADLYNAQKPPPPKTVKFVSMGILQVCVFVVLCVLLCINLSLSLSTSLYTRCA